MRKVDVEQLTDIKPLGDETTGSSPCGPSCGCNAAPRSSRVRTTVAILVLAGAALVLVVKFAGRAEVRPVGAPSPSTTPTGEVLAPEDAKPLGSFLELNTVAAKMDAVIVLVPGQGDGTPGLALSQAVQAARRKLTAKEMNVGVYTLRLDSPDYAKLAGRHALPGVAVFAGGGDKALVSAENIDAAMLIGEMSESRLLQAYVAASMGISGGGCNCAKAASCGGN